MTPRKFIATWARIYFGLIILGVAFLAISLVVGPSIGLSTADVSAEPLTLEATVMLVLLVVLSIAWWAAPLSVVVTALAFAASLVRGRQTGLSFGRNE
jgi:hypothetical protein